LDNEEENKFLAAANLEAVNVTDKDDDKSRQKHRNKQT